MHRRREEEEEEEKEEEETLTHERNVFLYARGSGGGREIEGERGREGASEQSRNMERALEDLPLRPSVWACCQVSREGPLRRPSPSSSSFSALNISFTAGRKESQQHFC